LSKSRILKIIIITLALTCLGALVFSGVSMAMGSQTIIRGVNVLNADLSGLSEKMAEERLLLLEKETIQGTPLVIRYGDRTWQVQPGNIGLTIDTERVVAAGDNGAKRGKRASAFLPM